MTMARRVTKMLRQLARIGLGLIAFVVILLVGTTIYGAVATPQMSELASGRRAG